MNNKILSLILVVGIASTWFAGISAANSGLLWEDIEQRVDAMESKLKSGKGMKHLTDDEKASLESMTDDEKTVFFTAKKEEKKAEKQAWKAVVDKLINGETLTADEEAIRLEILAKIEERSGKHSKSGAEIIAKILAWDELTSDEEIELAQMQEKQAKREAQRAIIEPIKAKLQAGETLSDEEQVTLYEMKKSRGDKKGHGKKSRGDYREEK